MSDDHKPGKFVWFELMTRDPDEAVRFYTEVVGWKHQASNYGGMRYDMLGPESDRMVAGVVPSRRPEVPNHWMGYLSVEDVDLCHKHVMDLGGAELQRPFDMPDIGRISAVRDPQGATFYLFKNEQSDPPDQGGPGTFHWVELWAPNPQAAANFYAELMGYDVETQQMPMGPYYTLKADGVARAGITRSTAAIPPMWIQYIEVDDLDAALVRVSRNRGKVFAEPQFAPGVGRFAVFQDAVGSVSALITPAGKE